MRVRYVALFFIVALAWSVQAHATTLDSQTDYSAQAIRPDARNIFLSVGYVPPYDVSIYGIRFRVNTSGSGDYVCPTNGAVMKYYSTSTPPTEWGDSGNVVGAIVNVATTTPDANGNCDYTTLDKYDRDVALALSPNYYYVFFMSTGGSYTKWVSMSGKTSASTTPLNFFGYRNAFSNFYEWGTTGLDSVYFEFFDTVPPPVATTPTLTLLGSATTTVEFGATFTDAGATASDTIDGDLTSSIRITGSVNTGVMGTTTLSYAVTNSSGLSATTTRDVVVACTHDCYDNVLFLPGIKGSHLYRPKDGCDASLPSCEDRLWEPGLDEGIFASLLRGAGNDDVHDLLLDALGASVRSDIYVKEKDVLDSVGGKDFYASFIADMDALKTDGTIADWEPVAYDWRLSLADIVEKGKKTGDRISYLEATSTPYIEQELRRLAASSKTGKVTIVAHSNGGLVAKTLLNQLGGETAKSLVDKIIMVGVPQSGAPRAIGSLLYGTGEGLPWEHFDFLLSKAVARGFSEYSPMAYHLLPSAQYFSDASDTSHAVGTFAGTSGFVEERAAYGPILDTVDELYDFLLARDGGREKPASSNVSDANVLDEALIDYARDTHTTADAWLPPSGITLYQIAGWGVDTIAGLRFTELPLATVGPYAATHRSMFSPTFVEDGDGVVPVPSALMTSTSSPNVERYWLNLFDYNDDTDSNRAHGSLFEISPLQDFIRNIIKNDTSTLPAYISTNQPSPITTRKKLVFTLHSPLTLQLTDSSGNTTGLSGADSVTQNIPGATYGEFGETQYIIAPEGDYTLNMDGQSDGTFTLEIQEMSGNDITSSATLANVPTTPNTLASLTISGGLSTVSALSVDEDGDGEAETSLTPVSGEIVNYEPPASTPEPQTSSRGGGGGGRTAPTPVQTIATTTVIIATTTETDVATKELASTTPVAVTSSPQLSTAIQRVSKKTSFVTPSSVSVTSVMPDLSQTASVYNASQQQVLSKLGAVVYNSLHRLWRGFKRMLLIET